MDTFQWPLLTLFSFDCFLYIFLFTHLFREHKQITILICALNMHEVSTNFVPEILDTGNIHI